jgi:hypothetical protein
MKWIDKENWFLGGYALLWIGVFILLFMRLDGSLMFLPILVLPLLAACMGYLSKAKKPMDTAISGAKLGGVGGLLLELLGILSLSFPSLFYSNTGYIKPWGVADILVTSSVLIALFGAIGALFATLGAHIKSILNSS